jgi:hypothetical protein
MGMSLRQWLGLDGFKTKTVVWLTTGIGGVVAAGVAGLIAVAGTLPKEELPRFAVGSTIEAGQWRIVPLAASIGPAGPDGRAAGPGRKVLMVELEMTNRTGSTRNDTTDVLRLDPALAKAAGQPMAYLERDRAILFGLHPDLTERVAIAWEMPEAATVPETLSLAVWAETYKAQNNLSGESGWYAPHPLGTLTLPVAAAGPPAPAADPT